MAREQTGICSEPNLHGLVLLFNALDGHAALLRRQFSLFSHASSKLAEQFSEANLNTTLAIGAAFWDTIYPDCRPPELESMKPLIAGDIEMPTSPADFVFYIRADRYDVLHLASQQLSALVVAHADLIEQTHVFRVMDGRALTGFPLDPPYIPGLNKRELALIDDAESEFVQGSYMHVQRYRLDFARWQSLTQEQQEHIVGRNKLTGQLQLEHEASQNTHALRTSLRVGEHALLPIVFQDMPFGQLRAQGVVQVAYSKSATAFNQWLQQRVGDGEHHYDLMLDYLQADSGAAFFAPSINFLEDRS